MKRAVVFMLVLMCASTAYAEEKKSQPKVNGKFAFINGYPDILGATVGISIDNIFEAEVGGSTGFFMLINGPWYSAFARVGYPVVIPKKDRLSLSIVPKIGYRYFHQDVWTSTWGSGTCGSHRDIDLHGFNTVASIEPTFSVSHKLKLYWGFYGGITIRIAGHDSKASVCSGDDEEEYHDNKRVRPDVGLAFGFKF